MPLYRMHKEGYTIVAVSFIIVLTIAIVSYFLFRNTNYVWFFYVIAGTSLLLMLLIINFFRNPVVVVAEDLTTVVAPCDGKVVAIEEVYEGKVLKQNVWQISIFMSPLNVHVNRSPISGVVKYCEHFKGKYLVAWHPKSSVENEHTFIVVENEKMKVAFKQVAGGLARRIKCYLQNGVHVKQGQEIGFIKFGSRMDIFIPLECEIKVKLKDITKGGKTVLAKLPVTENATVNVSLFPWE